MQQLGYLVRAELFFVGCIIFLKLNICFAKLVKILFVYMFVLSQEINLCGADNEELCKTCFNYLTILTL